MNIVSMTFLLFCISTIVIYFCVPKKLQWIVLFISSCFFLFYKNFSIETLLQALAILFTSYIFAILINKYRKKSKLFLAISIIIILLMLIYLKYTNLFLITFNHIFNLFDIKYQFNLVTRNSLIGISYYSLIMISYLVDVYRGTAKPKINPIKLALFMSYFPILTSGPFMRYEETSKNIYSGYKFNFNLLRRGLLRICWGMFKILVISQRLAIFVNTVHSNVYQYEGLFLVISMLFYSLQLYTNFSGSIDVIMGVSEILGITLPENFNVPFFSLSITEFWRRWHITLGAWLKDYIFYPLLKSSIMQKLNNVCKKAFGKKVGKKIPLYISMLIMWIFIGAWHGGEYKYIIASGLLQFIFIFLEQLWEPMSKRINKKLGINTESFGYKLYQMLRTYLLFSFSMIFFSANSVSDAILIIKKMFVWNPWVILDNNTIFTAGLDLLEFRVLILSIVILLVVEYLSTKMDVRDVIFNQNIIFRWIILISLLFGVMIFGCYGPNYDPAGFIYRNF